MFTSATGQHICSKQTARLKRGIKTQTKKYSGHILHPVTDSFQPHALFAIFSYTLTAVQREILVAHETFFIFLCLYS